MKLLLKGIARSFTIIENHVRFVLYYSRDSHYVCEYFSRKLRKINLDVFLLQKKHISFLKPIMLKHLMYLSIFPWELTTIKGMNSALRYFFLFYGCSRGFERILILIFKVMAHCVERYAFLGICFLLKSEKKCVFHLSL